MLKNYKWFYIIDKKYKLFYFTLRSHFIPLMDKKCHDNSKLYLILVFGGYNHLEIEGIVFQEEIVFQKA